MNVINYILNHSVQSRSGESTLNHLWVQPLSSQRQTTCSGRLPSLYGSECIIIFDSETNHAISTKV
jgi:hypothetical protein